MTPYQSRHSFPSFGKGTAGILGLSLAEVAIFIAAVLSWLLYRRFDLPGHSPFQLFASRLVHFLAYYTVGLLVALLLLRLRSFSRREDGFVGSPWKETLRAFANGYLTRSALLHDVRLLAVVSALFVVFLHLKHLIIFINPAARELRTVYDGAFLAFDQLLLGGETAGEFFQRLFGTGEAVAVLMSYGYTAFYGYLALLVLILVLQRDRILSDEFLAALSLLWLLGVSVVYFVPTWGPCFYLPESIHALPKTQVAELQSSLWLNMRAILDDPAGSTGIYLISGFPSLHLAAVVLGSMYLERINRLLAAASWIFALVTVATTLYFCWHYILDDIGGVILAFCVRAVVQPIYSLDYMIRHEARSSAH